MKQKTLPAEPSRAGPDPEEQKRYFMFGQTFGDGVFKNAADKLPASERHSARMRQVGDA